MLNKVILIGRLATDPELKYTAGGIAVTGFRLAVDRTFGSKSADGEKETDFLDIVTWRQTAEFCANYLHKGRLVAVDGRLQIRTWVAQDGSKRRTAEVVANDVRALDRAPRSSESDGDDYRLPPPPAAVPAGHAPPEWASAADPEFGDPFNDE